MFESLSRLGKALENFKLDRDTDKEDEKTSLEEYLDFQKAKEEFKPTEEQKSVMTMEDYPDQTKTGEEVLIEQAKTEKKEDQLDQKIKDIQKVLSSFAEKAEDVSVIKTENILDDPAKSRNMNLQPLDLGGLAQKQYISSFLPTSSSQTNRVDVLLQQLKNLGLS
jgi:hypothetical protein